MALCPAIPEAQFQTLTSASSWTVPGPNGSITYLFCFTSVNIYTHFAVGSASDGNSELIRTVSTLQSIVLPNNTFWGFVYDSNDPSSNPAPTIHNYTVGTGQLTTLIYPTGGKIRYTYTVGPGACNSGRPNGRNPGGVALLAYTPQIATRAMVDAQGNVLGTWSYEGGTIVSPDGNATVMNFASDPDAPYQCPTEANGNTSSVQSVYSNSMMFSSITCDYQGLNCVDAGSYSLPIGMPTSKTYLDFSGSTLKQEATTYQWQTNSAYLTSIS